MFTAGSTSGSVTVNVYPYSETALTTGYGAAISPVYVAELPSTVTSVDQIHVPTLLRGTSQADIGASFRDESRANVALSTNASTAALVTKVTGLTASSSYVCTLGARGTIWSAADATICGTIDETVDLAVATDADSVATVTVLGTQSPDTTRLPTGLNGATMSVAASTGGFTVSLTRPTDVACVCKARVWIDTFERIVI
jgi:hypothetical protein